MAEVMVCGAFDDLRSRDVRFLQEAARRGPVHVALWSDDAIGSRNGAAPAFPQEERAYFVRALRYVSVVEIVDAPDDPDAPPSLAGGTPGVWVMPETELSERRAVLCRPRGIACASVPEADLAGFPVEPDATLPADRPKVIVTGCYDWLHSGHVRFFEEASELGSLIVVVGHDVNVRLLKGEHHPLYPEALRRYMAGAIRFVDLALVSTGHGWMDAEPEIERLRPDIYLVNEDGDRPEKRAFCETHGLRYVVLRRLPKEGLPRRQSTDLRGF